MHTGCAATGPPVARIADRASYEEQQRIQLDFSFVAEYSLARRPGLSVNHSLKRSTVQIMKLLRQLIQALAILFAPVIVGPVSAEATRPLSAEQVEEHLQMLRPQPGESRWMEIDWYPSIWEARQKAAEEGKPIFIMAASGGAPPAGC